MQEPVNNPGVSAAIAIVISFIVANFLYLLSKRKHELPGLDIEMVIVHAA